MDLDLEFRLEELAKERRDRRYARHAVHNALKYGRLKKEPCACGEIKVEVHHPNYQKPLDVIWVCKKHHTMLDKMMRNPDSASPLIDFQ